MKNYKKVINIIIEVYGFDPVSQRRNNNFEYIIVYFLINRLCKNNERAIQILHQLRNSVSEILDNQMVNQIDRYLDESIYFRNYIFK